MESFPFVREPHVFLLFFSVQYIFFTILLVLAILVYSYMVATLTKVHNTKKLCYWTLSTLIDA